MRLSALTCSGRLDDVCVISSSKLPARNSVSLPPQTWRFTFSAGNQVNDRCGLKSMEETKPMIEKPHASKPEAWATQKFKGWRTRL
jgi:hypothetical protein